MKQNINKGFQIGLKALIFNEEGKILVLKRNKEYYPKMKNLWDIPGGRVCEGGTLLGNLRREVKEETGMRVLRILGILAVQNISIHGLSVVRITYISRVTHLKLKLSDEHTEFKWLSRANMLKMKGLDRYVRGVIKDNLPMSFIKDIGRYCYDWE